MTRRGIPLAMVWAAFPVLLTQGLRVRRTTLRLPEADGITGAVGAGDEPLHLLVIGDSVAAGVGIDHHRDTVAGRLAERLAAVRSRPVEWTVIARLGLTAGEVSRLVEGRAELGGADVVMVSVGVNDTKNLHGDRRWRTELARLLDDVLRAAPHADVVLLGVPPMEQFTALPLALRHLLGARARRIDRIGRQVAAARPRVRRLELDFGQPPADAELFARDGFHPSAAVHAAFAEHAGALVSG